jgi:hypothetical protein
LQAKVLELHLLEWSATVHLYLVDPNVE